MAILNAVNANTGTADDLAYYAATGVTVSPVTAANSGVVVTGATGIPSVLAGPGTSGNVLVSNVSGPPSFSTVTYPSAPGWANWTPTYSFSGGSGNVAPTWATSFTRYVQMGNVVYIAIELTNSSGGTQGAGTGIWLISLPITSGIDCGVTVPGWLSSAGLSYPCVGTISQGVTSMAVAAFEGTTNTTIIGSSWANANRTLILTGFYEI
jgi:hypothetical protein